MPWKDYSMPDENTSSQSSIVTRIAPSPTGDPHVGTAYVGLFNYVFAKQQNGKFILRVEDTDRDRYSPESEKRIMEMMHWLGLVPSESPEVGGENPPYKQSERLKIYQKYAKTLLDKKILYPSFMTAEELKTLREEQRHKKAPFIGYDGRERDIPLKDAKARMAAGEPYVLRLRTPETGQTNYQDELRGTISVPNNEIRDGVMVKQDGYPTYHFANVIDDHLMGVTHVIRGEDWQTSTPIHILLYEAFNWEKPKFIHLPLLRNADKSKSKISKRKVDTSVDSYKAQGILPEALLNFLGNMGWSMPTGEEFFSLQDMVDHFDYQRISLGGPVFDFKKLRYVNAHYLREVLSLEELGERVKPFLEEANLNWDNEDYLLDVLDVMRERVETLSDFVSKATYFFKEDFSFDEQAKKKLKSGQVHLGSLEREFALLDSYDYDSVDDLIRSYVKSHSIKMGEVMQPLRSALTGTTSSPDLIDVISILDRGRVLSRIGRALTYLTQGLPDDKPEKNQKEEAENKKGQEVGKAQNNQSKNPKSEVT